MPRSVSVERYVAGEAVPNPAAGDFILTHRTSFPSRMIAFGQALRFRGPRRPFARWSHAALVTAGNGQLVEALGNGVTITNISKYQHVEYHYVRLLDADTSTRLRVTRYALTMAERHLEYGWWEILSLGLQLATGARCALTTDGHMICSGLVATALERTNAIFPRNAGCMLPADLAAYYGIYQW